MDYLEQRRKLRQMVCRDDGDTDAAVMCGI